MAGVDSRRKREPYLQALLAGDLDAAAEIVAGLIKAKMQLADIYLSIMAPAMVRIGEMWCDAKINVAQEHLATQITLGQMAKLRLMQPVAQPLPHTIVVACVEGEGHFLGARMATDLFQLEGWSVDFLGPDVPTRALIQMVAARHPDVLCLSVTMESHRKAVSILLKSLTTIPEPPKVIVGGCLGANGAAWKSQLEGLEVVTNVIDGVNLLRKFFKPRRTQVLLAEYLKALGQRIRSLRQQAGWTQQHLADATKLTRAYVVSVEGGKQNLSMDVVVRLANALNVPPDQLIGRDE